MAAALVQVEAGLEPAAAAALMQQRAAPAASVLSALTALWVSAAVLSQAQVAA